MTPIYLFGPTAVGKSSFSIRLAERLGGEIINMDIGSFYQPLSIGVAKPNWRISHIPHHLFDILTDPEPYNVVKYTKQITPLIAAIQERGKVPIVVGGSGFYLRSLFFPPQAQFIPNSWEVPRTDDSNKVWQRLYELDPVRASKLHPNDTYRVMRSLQICLAGQGPVSQMPLCYNPSVPEGLVVCLYDDRVQLYDRINMRVRQMMHEGLLQEAQGLFGNAAWREFLYRKKVIGYVPLFEHFAGRSTVEHACHTIQLQTRRYAKRQLCFWRMLQKMFQAVTTKCQVRLLEIHAGDVESGCTNILTVLRQHYNHSD